MKKILLFFILAITAGLASCKKNNNNVIKSSGTSQNGFKINYDGTDYSGLVMYNGGPSPSINSKNLVTGYQLSSVIFSIKITNVPDAGIQSVCSSACDPSKGDINITFTTDGTNLSEFSGTVERVSSSTIKINAASKAGKTLTGTLQWK